MAIRARNRGGLASMSLVPSGGAATPPLACPRPERIPMAKLRVPQKAQRVLELLIGLGHPRVREALASHGFTVSARRPPS